MLIGQQQRREVGSLESVGSWLFDVVVFIVFLWREQARRRDLDSYTNDGNHQLG